MREKILVIQTAFLGDAVLTLPMLEKISGKFPGSEIHVIAIPSTEEVFRISPFCTKVIVMDKREKHKSIFALYKFSKLIRSEKYTRIYSPHRSFRTSLLVLLSGVKETVGFDNASMSFVYKKKIRYNISFHEVQRDLELIGIDTEKDGWKVLPTVKIPADIEVHVEKLIDGLGENCLIAVAPGSVWATKVYPSEYYIEVIKNLTGKGNFVFLIGGKNEEQLCVEIEKKAGANIKSFAGKLSVQESISLLRKCRLLISNDSAPTHLAMCAGIPVITLYCSTVPAFGFYPYNPFSKHLSYDDLKCKPCGIHGYDKCPIGTFECGWKLLPQNVIDCVESLNI